MMRRLLTTTAMAGLLMTPLAAAAGTPGTTAQERISEARMHRVDNTSGAAQHALEDQNMRDPNAPHPLFIDARPEPAETTQTTQAPETPKVSPEPGDQVAAKPDDPTPVNRTRVYFDLDQAHLRETGQAKLERVADRAQSADAVVVKGYTDTSASATYNAALSRARAHNVAWALTSEGVNAGKVRADWFGERKLAVETADGVVEQQNRRTVIVVKD